MANYFNNMGSMYGVKGFYPTYNGKNPNYNKVIDDTKKAFTNFINPSSLNKKTNSTGLVDQFGNPMDVPSFGSAGGVDVESILRSKALDIVNKNKAGGGGGGGGWGPTISKTGAQILSSTSNSGATTGVFPGMPYSTENGYLTAWGIAHGYKPVQPGDPAGAAPGSAADIAGSYNFELTPDQLAAQEAQKAYLDSLNYEVSPEEEYQKQLALFQKQIDATNKVYADMLNQARAEGQGRIESRQFSQGRSGQIGSGTGEAGINAVIGANQQEQNAIRNEQNMKIQAILGVVSQNAVKVAAEKTAAKKAGAEALLKFYDELPQRKAFALSSVVGTLLSQGIDPSKMSDEELAKITSGLGVNKDDIFSAYGSAKAASEKEGLANKKTQAEIDKIYADINNWGKMTDYQKQSLAIQRYTAYHGSGATRKANAIGQIASELNKDTALPDGKTYVMDVNGYVTPEGYKYMVLNAPQMGVTKQDVLEAFGHLLYYDPKYGYTSYGLTPADEKLIRTAPPSYE
jgi:hypothetical protein